MENIQEFCGLDKNSSFILWDKTIQNFSKCFTWTVVSNISHGIFVTICAFLLGSSRRKLRPFEENEKRWPSKIISLLMIVECLSEVILTYTINHNVIPAYIVAKGVELFCWVLCFVLQYRGFSSKGLRKKQKLLLLFASLIILVSYAFQIHAVIKTIINSNADIKTWPVQYFGVFISLFLVLCFVVVCLSSIKYQEDYVMLVNPDQKTINQGSSSDDSSLSSSYEEKYSKNYGKLDSNSCDDFKTKRREAGTSNILSQITLWWVNKLVLGKNARLKTADDLFLLPDNLKTDVIREKFSNTLRKEREKQATNKNHKRSSLLGILNRTYGKIYYSIGILKFIMLILQFSGPIFLNYLIKFMQNRTEPVVHGYYYAGALCLVSLLNVFINGHYFYYLEVVRVYLRGSLITAIYEKTLSTSSSTLNSRFTTGQVVNYITTDVDRVLESCYDFHELWGVPIQLAVCLYLLNQQVGVSVLASVGIIVVFSPTTWFVTTRIKKLMEEMMILKDQRVKIITEILHGIRIIKFYAWENHFEEKANEARNDEMRVMRIFKYFQAFCIFFWVSTPYFMCVGTFVTYVLLGNSIDAATVFTTIALLSILNAPFNDLPWCITGLTNAYVSLKRLDVFLSMPEIDYEGYYLDKTCEDSPEEVLSLKDGAFTWKDETAERDIERIKSLADKKEKEKEKMGDPEKKDNTEKDNIVPFVLRDIDLRLPKGSLIGITGKVGSGKTSLFTALIADMQKISGSLHVEKDFDGFAYVAQEAWIQNLTVKDNILYGQPFDQEKYDNVLYACALLEDLKILPAGDMTEIGENGINLSGGQKARVAFARAVYQDKEIYLMDDPLAAVDSHVASHLFKHCIMGILKDKTRILSTHHIKYLRNADTVILMKDGNIVVNGKPEDVLSNEEVVQLEEENLAEEKEQQEVEKKDETEEKVQDEGKLVDEEERQTGTVNFDVYKYYLVENGLVAATIMFSFIAFQKVFKNLGDWWLAHWTGVISKNKIPFHNIIPYNNHTKFTAYTTWSSPAVGFHHILLKDTPIQSTSYFGDTSGYGSVSDELKYYLGIYCGLMLGGCVSCLIRTLANANGCVRASIQIHKKLLHAIIRAPVAFFDITPIGRIINRFSSDIYSVDSECAIYFGATCSILGTVLGSFVMACYSLPWFTVVLIPLIIIYYYTQSYYRNSSRELKRLLTITKSPIYQHFSETLSGLTTIKAFRQVQRFILQNEDKLDANQRAYFSAQVVEVWLALRLGGIGVLMVTGVAILSVVEHQYESISPGLVGLAVTVCLQTQGFFKILVTVFTRLEKGMVNTERVLHYVRNTAPEELGFGQVPAAWPVQGAICFKNVSLKYRENLPLVLNNISLNIFPGEKIGICGRTGSGKSSLFRLLFKIVQMTNGDIIIDDTSLKGALTEKIRSQMSIIPQEPFLFDDTVSQNLDPKNEYSDEEKLDVLEKCHLTKAVRDLGGLTGSVGERGNNFSAGQKQLICLARALLKKAKIICIDEATASVDLATDGLIQQTIRSEFSSSTVLTIAHRLETILDSDRVLVMDYGEVGEFASPSELLVQPNSLFASLVKESRRQTKS